MWYLPSAKSLVEEGNLDLNEYEDLIKTRSFYAVIKINYEK